MIKKLLVAATIVTARLVILVVADVFLPSAIIAANPSLSKPYEITVSRSSLNVDGILNERIWQSLKGLKLKPAVPGVPEELGGEIQIVLRGNYLCLGMFCPEPDGKVLAKSFGYNPVWAKDAYSSPEVEDRLVCVFSYKTAGGRNSELKLEINPWGALRLEQNSRLVPSTGILVAAGITLKGWTVETAVPLDELGVHNSSPGIKLSLVQVRSRRALAPEFRWSLKGPGKSMDLLLPRVTDEREKDNAPRFTPPLIGNAEPPLQVGRVQVVPGVENDWDDPFWKRVPGFHLPKNEPCPHQPDYPTEVKWVHDGKTLAVFFRCAEDERVNCDVGARDGNLGSDDHVSICLATTGSSLIEILVNPAAAIRDSKGSGPHMYSVGSGAWNGNIEANCEIEHDVWTARINLPLDEIASALGELAIPKDWRVLIGRVRQPRVGATGELSTIPVIGNPYLHAPLRYRRLSLTGLDPTCIKEAEPMYLRPHKSGLAGELQEMDSYTLTRVQRKYYDLQGMLDNYFARTTESLAMEEHGEWDSVKTLEDWERFRDKRIKVLKSSSGEFPDTPPPLLYQVSGTYEGEGYQVKNISYQSRPGLFVAANLYLPEKPTNDMPGIIIIPSHHYPKTQGELKDCGMIWARSGCAVLIPDGLGCGERIETLPWHRQPYQSDYLFEMQLNLIGQTRLGWVAWDIIRSVDLLCEMDNIDRKKIILIGSVTWGGGRPAAIAGLFDKRIAALIPFNFGRVYWDSYEIRNSIIGKITPWFICCSAAPRKFIYAHEFSWEGDEGPVHPSVWVPAWPRYEKVYNLYEARENLETVQGKGLLRVRETEGDCYSLGSVQRQPLYPLLKKWFDIPLPSQQDQDIQIDSELSFAKNRPDYAALKMAESMRRMPDSALLSITPEISSEIHRKPMHLIAAETGKDLLLEVREKRARLDETSSRQNLTNSLASILGDIEPDRHPLVEPRWSKKLSKAVVEALTLQLQDGTIIPVLLLKPETGRNSRLPLLIALSEGGKERFLKDRSRELGQLIQNGITVCLLDVRGTGESAAGQYNRSAYPMIRAAELGKTLLGFRVKDVRTVLEYLKSREDIDSHRIALWGDSFTPVNTGNLWLDELSKWPISPQIQHFASPLGAHLALLTALYHKEIKTVAARGSLVSYLSVLDDNFTYVPPDIIVPEILKVGDISDICAGLAPRSLLLEKVVDGRNFPVTTERLNSEMNQAELAYQRSGGSGNLIIRTKDGNPGLVRWLIKQLSL
jgi:hypothetical protein